jgi:HEPN domain-containing protein
MPNPNPVFAMVRAWVVKAEHDLKTAVHTLTLGKEAPTDTVSFHAQQRIEKYLKALLVLHGVPFPKTHAIRRLTALLPAKLRPKIVGKVKDRLTEYATVMRYPDVGTDIPLREAREAVALAKRVRKDVSRQMPRAALRGLGR